MKLSLKTIAFATMLLPLCLCGASMQYNIFTTNPGPNVITGAGVTTNANGTLTIPGGGGGSTNAISNTNGFGTNTTLTNANIGATNLVATGGSLSNVYLFGNAGGLTNFPAGAINNGGTNLALLTNTLNTISGNGAGLTNISPGALPASVVTNNESGVTLSGTFSGNGNGLSNLYGPGITGLQQISPYTLGAVRSPLSLSGCESGNVWNYTWGSNQIYTNGGGYVINGNLSYVWLTNYMQNTFSNGMVNAGYRCIYLYDGTITNYDSNGIWQLNPRIFPSGLAPVAQMASNYNEILMFYTSMGTNGHQYWPSAGTNFIYAYARQAMTNGAGLDIYEDTGGQEYGLAAHQFFFRQIAQAALDYNNDNSSTNKPIRMLPIRATGMDITGITNINGGIYVQVIPDEIAVVPSLQIGGVANTGSTGLAQDVAQALVAFNQNGLVSQTQFPSYIVNAQNINTGDSTNFFSLSRLMCQTMVFTWGSATDPYFTNGNTWGANTLTNYLINPNFIATYQDGAHTSATVTWSNNNCFIAPLQITAGQYGGDELVGLINTNATNVSIPVNVNSIACASNTLYLAFELYAGPVNGFIGYFTNTFSYTTSPGVNLIIVAPYSPFFGGNPNANNLFVMPNAGISVTSGHDDIYIGTAAAFRATNGYANTVVGSETAGWLNDNNDCFFGYNSGPQASPLTGGYDNNGYGANSLNGLNSTGNDNNAFGRNALLSVTSGSFNIGIGGNNQNGGALTTGSENIDIGNNGLTNDSGITRIGTPGNQTLAYIAGVVIPSGGMSASNLTGTLPYSVFSAISGSASGTILSNSGSGLVWAASSSLTNTTTTQTNFVLNQVYKNATGLVGFADSWYSIATIAGANNAGISLMVSNTGYSAYSNVAPSGVGLTALSIAMPYTNWVGNWIQTNASFYFTNVTTGSSTVALVPGTGFWTISGNSQASSGSAFQHTPSYALTDGSQNIKSFAHGLGSVPSYNDIVLVCTTADSGSGFSVGQEIKAVSLWNSGSPPNAEFFAWADSTNVYVEYFGDAGAGISAPNGSGFSSMNNFSMKAYYAK